MGTSVEYDKEAVIMKVSNFFRYFFSILSILAAFLGMLYFAMYNCNDVWKRYESLVMDVTSGSVFVTEIANIIYLVTKAYVKPMPKKIHIKTAAKMFIPLLLIASLCAFILGGDAFYFEIAFLLLDIVLLIGGDMVDYTEVIEVETKLYEGDECENLL